MEDGEKGLANKAAPAKSASVDRHGRILPCAQRRRGGGDWEVGREEG